MSLGKLSTYPKKFHALSLGLPSMDQDAINFSIL